MSDDHATTIPSWVWWTTLGIGCAVVVAFVLFYVRHPDRSPFADFSPRVRLGPPQTNGAVPHPPSRVGADVDGGAEAGEEG